MARVLMPTKSASSPILTPQGNTLTPRQGQTACQASVMRLRSGEPGRATTQPRSRSTAAVDVRRKVRTGPVAEIHVGQCRTLQSRASVLGYRAVKAGSTGIEVGGRQHAE